MNLRDLLSREGHEKCILHKIYKPLFRRSNKTMYQITQHKFWGALALIMSIMLVVFMVACGDDDDDDNDTGDDDDDDNNNNNNDAGEPPPPKATTVTGDPAPGGAAIPSNTEFKLTFDQGVKSATINGGPTVGSGLSFSGPAPGLASGQSAILNIEWVNRDDSPGSATLGPYTIEDPDEQAPEVQDSTINDGDDAVDPAAINAGGIKVNFQEDVSGSIQLTLEDGTDNKWSGNVAGRTASLTVVAGQELANETAYKVEIDVKDGAGNATKLTINFTTKPKD
jgi:hypothetical protein